MHTFSSCSLWCSRRYCLHIFITQILITNTFIDKCLLTIVGPASFLAADCFVDVMGTISWPFGLAFFIFKKDKNQRRETLYFPFHTKRWIEKYCKFDRTYNYLSVQHNMHLHSVCQKDHSFDIWLEYQALLLHTRLLRMSSNNSRVLLLKQE